MAERVREVKGRHSQFRRPGETVANPGKIFARIMKEIFSHYGVHLVIVMVCILISVLANVQGTLFLQTLIDTYIEPMIGAAHPDYSGLSHAILRVAVFYLIGVGASFTYNRLMIYVNQGTLRNLRLAMFEKMESLPLRYFDTHTHGDIMSVYTNDIDTLRQMISQSIPQILNSSITILSVLISMVRLSIPLTLTTLAMVGVMLFVTTRLAKRSGYHFVRQQKALGDLNGYIEEMMTGQKVVKVFCHEEASIEEFRKKNEELYENSYAANRYASILMPVNAQIGNVSYVICAIFGGILAIYGYGGLSLGMLASFLTFNKSFNMPINQVSQQFNSIVMAMAGADRVFRLLDEQPENDEGKITLVNARTGEDGSISESAERTGAWAWKRPEEDGSFSYVPLKGDVRFHQVDFGYDPEKKMVLHDIELYAKPGQKIAFVGSTGAGKTTITNLINRFYDVQDGQITYDGIDVKEIRKSDLRRSLGIVLQETNLFTATVRENIRYGRLDATDEEIERAAKLANADGFIRRLPDGYDTVLSGNGGNLSQGQRQLLSIARAAVADPPVLILDEATSSIDTHTEKLVQSGMDQLMKGRTTFVIAHRLSTVRDSNCIIVLENGRIIEKGTHEELLELGQKYYQLYTGSAAVQTG